MESDKSTTEVKTKVDTEEISLLLIGTQDEQKRAINLIDKHLRGALCFKIRQVALSLNSEELAQVYQEVLLNVWDAAREKRYDANQPLLPFLFTLAQRRAVDLIRKTRIRRKGELELLDEIAETLKDTRVGEAWQIVVKRDDGRKRLELMRRSIARMPRRQRQVAEVVIERFHEEPTHQDICDEIYKKTGEHLTVVMVKGAWREARKKIKEVLIDAGYLEENELGE
jgi:DNA-directed RNA polymerase specialized sigma24 family protein